MLGVTGVILFLPLLCTAENSVLPVSLDDFASHVPLQKLFLVTYKSSQHVFQSVVDDILIFNTKFSSYM